MADMPYPSLRLMQRIAVEIDDAPRPQMAGYLNRLHWNVFGPQSDITVQDGNSLTRFAYHAIGLESMAADPPSLGSP